tara:strand:+ start:2816 stop:3127 length:312 start_codon:yes stop_codon:yes gene_type:complete
MKRGIYECRNNKNKTIYIGSSSLSIDKLENNHRNYFEYPDGKETKFRKKLRKKGKDWTFRWILEPIRCTEEGILTIEGAFIKYVRPKYNVDLDPVRWLKKNKK